MGFVASPQLPLHRALQRVALGESGEALRRLRAPGPTDVHEVRKSCKKLRAWLRLLRPHLGSQARAAELLVREAQRALAGRREAAVVPATLRRLRGSRVLASSRWRALEALLRRSLRRQSARARQHNEVRAADLLRAVQRLVEQWPAAGLRQAEVLAGLRAGYRRARQSLRRCAGEASALRLHDWRKRAKQHFYQRALLAKWWPALAGPPLQALDLLGETLGKHHDLEVLRTSLLALPAARARLLRQPVLQELERRERHLARKALRLGQPLFDQRPQQWLRGVAAHGRAGRGKEAA